MSYEQAKRIQETCWKALEREDIDALVALFATDASFSDPRFAPFEGLVNIKSYFQALFSRTNDYGGAHAGPYMLRDGEFAVWTRSRFRHRDSGRLVDFPLVAFFSYRPSDGKVVSYEEYWDTAAVLRQ